MEDRVSEIKPIPTGYAGCRFRSRLEARYAVWFDSLGIKWLYEPEGYTVGPAGRQTRYLPDFYLPELALWVEVKGHEAALDLTVLVDAAHPEWGLPLAIDQPDREWPLSKLRLLLLGPIPDVPLFQTALVAVDRRIVAAQKFTPLCAPAPDHSVDHEHRFTGVLAPIRIEWGQTKKAYEPPAIDLLGSWGSGFPCWQIERAYRAARSARFEHGESGAPR